MTKKTKRLIRVRVATALAYITYAIMMLVIAGLAYLALDFLGLVAWAVSGQVPEGGFNTGYYIGRVSYIIISLIIK
jgi:hypothetical protein